MVGSSRICERVVTHQSIGYTHRSRTFPKACISTSSAVRRGRLRMQKEGLSGEGKTKTLDFETPFGYFRKVAMATHRKENAWNLQVFWPGKRSGWKMLLVGDPL